MCFGRRGLLVSIAVGRCGLLYESRKDDGISGLDYSDLIVGLAQGTFGDGDNGPLVRVDEDGSLNGLWIVRKKDLGAVEHDLI